MNLVITLLLIGFLFFTPLSIERAIAFIEKVTFIWVVSNQNIQHHNDTKLIENFEMYKSEFEQLRRMISEDKDLERVDDTWVSPKNLEAIRISEERVAKYRNIFRKIGIPRGIAAYDLSRRSILFISSTQGLSVSGSAKGYAWLAEKPSNLHEDLDSQFSRMGRHEDAAYRHIEGNWYLYVEKN
ncbi:MAG: hypothetical protein WA705_02155 [Candidatus Ozemobacteraceae bacterium]